jgi:hypothetical protein
MAAHYPVVRGVGAFGFSAASITNHIIGGTSGISEDGDLILIFLHSANQAFTASIQSSVNWCCWCWWWSKTNYFL